MGEDKTKMEFLRRLYYWKVEDVQGNEVEAIGIYDAETVMGLYADQENRNSAIGFGEWLNKQDCQGHAEGYKIWADGYDGIYSMAQLYDAYQQSIKPLTPQTH